MSDTEVDAILAYPQSRDKKCPMNPPPAYLELQRDRPVTKVRFPSGEPTWLITGHEHCRQLLADPRVSSDWRHPNFPFPVPNPRPALDHIYRFTKVILAADPPDHTIRRRMLAREFTVRQAEALRPRVRRIVDAQIDAMLASGPPVDLVRMVSDAVPFMVICELVGVPFDDRDFFRSRTAIVHQRNSTAEERERAVDDLMEYFDGLVTAKEADPGDDVVGRLVIRDRESGVFTHDLLVSLMFQLLMAGYETSGEMISLGVAGLLGDPDQLAALRADPSLMPGAVEELLRFFSVGGAVVRVATEDIGIGGQVIRAGEGIVLHLATAARDGRAFADPDRIDIRRGSHSHLAFGHGVHQCLGQNVTRVELSTVFTTLLSRIPNLRLAQPVQELRFKYDSLAFGLYELSVTW
jgi:pentalenic acid synthase